MTKTAPLAIVLALFTAACESESQAPAEFMPDGGSPPSQGSEPEAAITAASHLASASDKQAAPNRSWSLTELHQVEPSASGESVPPESRIQGFQVPEDGDNPPAPPLADAVRARAELAALESELRNILDPILAALQERGVTLEQMERVQGDIEAERALLDMTAAEYDEILAKLARITARAEVLMQSGPRPLTRDGRGGGEQICTTDRTVDERGDGTIVIHDHETCRPAPTGGGGRGGCVFPGPGCGDGPSGGGGSHDQMSEFEHACSHAGGAVDKGKCRCDISAGCRETAMLAAPTVMACTTHLGCFFTLVAYGVTIWKCRQLPCDRVNRQYKR